MKKTLTLIIHPKCSKSQQVLNILSLNQIEPIIIDILDDGIDADDVVRLAKQLEMHPAEFVRKKEPEFKRLKCDEFSIEEWADIIEKSPILLERPIAIMNENAIICRPPEKIITLIKSYL